MYTLHENGLIERGQDGAFIPADPSNADYRAFLDWEKDGNTASMADGPSASELDAKARAEALPIRQHALDVLAGMGLDMMVAGNQPAAQACVVAREQIMDMGTLDLSGCADYQARRQAYKARWGQIAGGFDSWLDLKARFAKAVS